MIRIILNCRFEPNPKYMIRIIRIILVSLRTESKIYVAKHLKHPNLSLRMDLTSILENKVDAYVQSLYMHDARNKLWRDHVTNKELYGRIPRITDTIRHISIATGPSFHCISIIQFKKYKYPYRITIINNFFKYQYCISTVVCWKFSDFSLIRSFQIVIIYISKVSNSIIFVKLCNRSFKILKLFISKVKKGKLFIS